MVRGSPGQRKLEDMLICPVVAHKSNTVGIARGEQDLYSLSSLHCIAIINSAISNTQEE